MAKFASILQVLFKSMEQPQTINYKSVHLNRLEKAGLVELKESAKSKMVTIPFLGCEYLRSVTVRGGKWLPVSELVILLEIYANNSYSPSTGELNCYLELKERGYIHPLSKSEEGPYALSGKGRKLAAHLVDSGKKFLIRAEKVRQVPINVA